MKGKGVSAIIATILLLMITIALAGTAYIFMSGMLGGKTQKVISILDASCSDDTITLVISNDGTVPITTSSDLKFFVNNEAFLFDMIGSETSITAHNTTIFTNQSSVTRSGIYSVLIVSPSNSVRETVYC